jgi:methionyl-tRNA formyltransferase
VFLGQYGAFSALPLRTIAEKFTVVGVTESAPRGKLRWLQRALRSFRSSFGQEGLRRFARKNGIPFYYLTKENMEEFASFLKRLAPDLLCMASVSQLLPRDILGIPHLGVLNVHPSLLPQYRGPNPLFWQLYDMATEGGVTIHFADEGEDTGDIVAQRSFSISPDIERPRLARQITELGATLLLESLDLIATRRVARRFQANLPCPHRARNIRSDERLIPWSEWPIERVFHVLRTTRPWYHELDTIVQAGWFWQWEVSGFAHNPCDTPPASLHRDADGFYLSHPQGRIHLQRHISVKAILRKLLL